MSAQCFKFDIPSECRSNQKYWLIPQLVQLMISHSIKKATNKLQCCDQSNQNYLTLVVILVVEMGVLRIAGDLLTLCGIAAGMFSKSAAGCLTLRADFPLAGRGDGFAFTFP